ncbi:MAG: hypothetical protein KDD06_02835, partial [Phaeodactylibacter sp.]|nr:hypothetical protein [Phaeodactylibacter sp.]
MGNTIETYVDYIQNQLPGLKSGDYTVDVSQTITAAGVSDKNKFSSQTLNFSIRGERFNLKPADIASVYPPPNSLGEHSSVFPQVVFARNTLPWERMIAEPKDKTDHDVVEAMPWMALLVFNEGELGEVGKKDEDEVKVKIKDEVKDEDESEDGAKDAEAENGTIMLLNDFLKLPNLQLAPDGHKPTLESDENGNDKLTVIQVKKSLLRQLLPAGEELAQLCHARESSLRINLQEKPTKDSLYYEMRDAEGQLAHAAHVAVDTTKASQQLSLDPGKLKAGDYSVKVWIDKKAITVKPETIKITANDEFGQKVAIVPANRLPKPGARSIVHLVSLEERYYWDGKQYSFY